MEVGEKESIYTYRYTVTTRAPSLINRTVSVDVKHHVYLLYLHQDNERGCYTSD